MNSITIPADEVRQAREAGVEADSTGLAIMRLIKEYGVDTIFGIPGTHNLEFYRHLDRLGIRAVTTRHEQGAGYAADAWAQRKRLPGVVITTSGPGLLNVLSAAGTAYCESRPMIILAPGPARGEEFSDNGSLHETKDQLGAASAVVAWGRRVQSADEAVDAVHDAFEFFRRSRPRPVYIEVPLDVLEGSGATGAGRARARERELPTTGIATQIRDAARLLCEARRPVLLAGGGAVEAYGQVRRVADALGAPVVTTLNGKGVVPESHPLSIGAEPRFEVVRQLLKESDALLVVGSKLGEVEFVGHEMAPSGALIRIDIDPSQMGKKVAEDCALIGDASIMLGALEDLLPKHAPAAPWCDVPAIRAAVDSEAAESAHLLNRLAARIQSVLPEGSLLTGDSSQITYNGMMNSYCAMEPSSFLFMHTYCTLGYGLPAAIGAKIASPEKTVVSVLGDGALMFSLQEFQTAVEQELDLTVVCVDNGGYEEIRQNEIARGISPVGVQLSQPDWPRLIDAFGGRGYAISSEVQLETAISTAIGYQGVSLVHVPLALFRESGRE